MLFHASEVVEDDQQSSNAVLRQTVPNASSELVHDVDVVGLGVGTLLCDDLPRHGALGDLILREITPPQKNKIVTKYSFRFN